jgi:hypothetical protein
MNPELIFQLVSQRVSEVRQEATSCQLAAASREPRESVKERAGWALINAGLKLTGAPNPPQHGRPRPASL